MPYMDNREAERFVQLYADMILKICILYLKQKQDAEDICQDVFLKRILLDKGFESEEHEKAWIIRTAINSCKDQLRKRKFRITVPLDEVNVDGFSEIPDDGILEYVMKLPEKYRISLFLHYYEGYKVQEIASLLNRQPNTVSVWLSRGKEKLRKLLDEDR